MRGPFQSFTSGFSFLVQSKVRIPDGWASTELVLRFYNPDNTGTVLGDLCTLALLPNYAKYTLKRSLVVSNKRSDDHPQTWTPRLVRPEFWRSLVLRVAVPK